MSAKTHEEALPAEACSAPTRPKPLAEGLGAPAQAPSRFQPDTVPAAAIPVAGVRAPAPQPAIAVPMVRLHVLAWALPSMAVF